MYVDKNNKAFDGGTCPDRDTFPAWSPDGKKITFVTDRDGNYEIYVMDADGSNQKNLTNNPAEDTEPEW